MEFYTSHHCKKISPDRPAQCGRGYRAQRAGEGSSGRPLPPEPVADCLAHDKFLVMTLEPGQFFGEHRHALPVRTWHAGDVGAPEAAPRAERVIDLADVFVDVAIGVGLARIARRARE